MIQNMQKTQQAVASDHAYCKPQPTDEEENRTDDATAPNRPKQKHSVELKKLLLFGPEKDRRSLWPATLKTHPAALKSSIPTNFPVIDDELKSLKDITKLRLDHIFPRTPRSPPRRHIVIKPQLKKPPFSYRELAEFALMHNSAMTVGQICSWIMHRFDYYRLSHDIEHWKPGIRRALSKYSKFQKSSKVPGVGHLWCLQNLHLSPPKMRVHSDKHWKRQKLAQYKKNVARTCKLKSPPLTPNCDITSNFCNSPSPADQESSSPLSSTDSSPQRVAEPDDSGWEDYSFSLENFEQTSAAVSSQRPCPVYSKHACLTNVTPYTAVCESGIMGEDFNRGDSNHCALFNHSIQPCFPPRDPSNQDQTMSQTLSSPSQSDRDNDDYFGQSGIMSPGASGTDTYYSPQCDTSDNAPSFRTSSNSSSRKDEGSTGPDGDAWATVCVSTISLSDLPALGFEDVSVYQSPACLEL